MFILLHSSCVKLPTLCVLTLRAGLPEEVSEPLHLLVSAEVTYDSTLDKYM